MTFYAVHAQNAETYLEDLVQNEGFSAYDLEEWMQTRSNLNAATREDLEHLGFLSPYQVASLLDYQKRYGTFFTWQEVLLIPGFSKEDTALLQLFFTLEEVKKAEKITWRSLLKQGRNTLMMQTRTFFPRGTEYSPITEQEYLKRPNSRYLGKPWYRYARYDYRLKNKLQCGFVLESDAGEKAPADFISVHVQAKDMGVLKTLVVGDYRARFGQGLLLWNGMLFGKASSTGTLCNKEMGLTAYASRDENKFFRGAGAHFNHKNLNLTVLFSYCPIDARVTEEGFTSLVTTGYHRTPLELEKKNTLQAQVAGMNFSYKRNDWKVGVTLLGYGYDKPDAGTITYYNVHKNRTLPFGGVSADMMVRLRSLRFFSELAIDLGGAPAVVAGAIHYGKNGSKSGLLLRLFSPRYTTAYGAPLGRNSTSSNEMSVQLTTTQPLPSRWKIEGSVWMYHFPRPRYLCRMPSYGWDTRVQLHKKDHHLQLRQQRSLSDKGTLDKTLLSLRTGFSLSPNLTLWLRSDGTYSQLNDSTNYQMGGAAYAELGYDNKKSTLRGSLRLSVFYTGSWDSRIYFYERDVLYGFSIPALYGKGVRSYLNIKYTPFSFFEVWFKMACQWKETVSFDGKIQIRVRF